MAKKKPRTPPPPRRVQAPKTRTGPSRTSSKAQTSGVAIGDLGMRQRALLYGIAGSGVVALVAVVLLVALGGGGGFSAKKAAKVLAANGCSYKHYPALPRSPHYDTLTPKPKPKWNSYPPSSGRHYYQPVLWGDYTEPVPLIKEVHNLEHGGVIIQYGNKVPQADVDKIDAFWQKDPTAMLVAPLPNLGNKIAMTAWTNWAECSTFREPAFKAFQSAFRYHAPESSVYPKSALQPGT
jgi:Protein of unknown function (DUF3105)